jgi:hypothetical protein
MGNWLVARFTLSGVTFQNWMMVALALVSIGGTRSISDENARKSTEPSFILPLIAVWL